MSVSPGSPILLSDLQSLATLATTKLSPSTAYSFTAFGGSDVISPPTSISVVATYGTGSWSAGAKATIWVYSYKTIAGTKTYSWTSLVKALIGVAGSGNFNAKWTWVAATGTMAPDGYLITLPQPYLSGFRYAWIDIGNVLTFTEDGTFTNPLYKFDTTLDANNSGNPTQNLPCGHGTWLKTLNQIHNDLFTNLDLFGGSKYTFSSSFLLSGPWCVSVAPKCYLFINSTSVYNNLQFWYSEADSITGNQLSPEADMFDNYIGVNNGTNLFNWDRNVIVNGTVIIMSSPQGQNQTDWTVTASDPSIVITFDAHYVDSLHGVVTAFIFTFTNTQYLFGTPITLTVTPLAGGSVIGAGSMFGAGALVNCTFTGDKVVYTASDQTAIHLSGPAAKSVALASTLTNIVLTTPTGGANSNESHHRSYCNGVFVANALATLGIFPYVDVDLPQYQPSSISAVASTRRIALNDSLPYIASVDNRGALWPVFRDTDFVPDLTDGKPINGSKAWQVLGTKYVIQKSVTLNPPTMDFNFDSTFIPIGTQDVRYLSQNPNSVLYVRANDFPDLTNFDATAPGGTWISLAVSVPGFATDTRWFAGVYNPTTGAMTSVLNTIQVQNSTAPNGLFFNTTTDGLGVTVPNKEGYSYHIADPASSDNRPIPEYGYCVSSITIRRQPVDNGSGIAIAPTTGTANLSVAIGIMENFGFDSAGTFTALQTIVVPAGQASITTTVFLPVLSGTPLAYQATEVVFIRCEVNFQPIVQSSFSPSTVTFEGSPYVVGYYNGTPFYDPVKSMLFFIESDPQRPIVTPIAAVVVNDLTATLNLLP